MKCKPVAKELVSSMMNGTSVILQASISDQPDTWSVTLRTITSKSSSLIFMDLMFSISIICAISKHP